MKALALFSLASLIFAPLGAAEIAKVTPRAAALASAKAAARQNNPAQAEQLLLASNSAAPNSYDWHVESAQRLVLLAHSLPREGGSTRPVPALVTSALQHLSTAEVLAPDNRTKAAAKALAGHVYENFRGDRQSALASYRAAAQLSPENPVAKRAADRLQRLEDNLRVRSAKR